MPEFDFQLTGLFQTLDNDVLLAELLFFPEISCLGDDRAELLLALEENARRILPRIPAEDIHRRLHAGPPGAAELIVRLEPPRRSVAWREPVELRIPIVAWRHGDDHHLACIPALDIEVVAPSGDELNRMLPLHVRNCLVRTKRNALAALGPLQRCREFDLEPMTVAVELKTPRRLAEEITERTRDDFKTLREVGVDLILLDLAEAFEVRETVARVAEVLTGRNPRSVLLVGPSGVGKTAVMHELVRRRHEFQMSRTPFWATSGSRLVAGMSGFGMWQKRCQELWRERSKTKTILHIGHLMELLDVGKSEHRSQGIASFLRPWLARGELLAVAECLPEQKHVIERQDPHLLQSFVEVPVEEPDRHKGRVILTDFALSAVVARPPSSVFPLEQAALDTLDRLHRRYATYSAYPGRPLRFLGNLLLDLPPHSSLSEADVTAAFSRETGLPLFLLDERVPLDLNEARRWFASRVIGQAEAVDLVVDLLATVKAQLARPKKPLASLLFIGPTGVGKTEMAKALATYLFGSPQRLTRFDMSEYGDALAVQRLIGSVVCGEGLLTARVREQPFSVILLDEFEKAHPLLFDLLLQVLGEGRLTDSSGRLADFCNSVVIMTSNLGAATYQQGTAGFGGIAPGAGEQERRHARDHFLEEVRRFVRPELFNRIDRVVPFVPLDETTILGIAHRQLDLLKQRDGVRHRGTTLTVSDDTAAWLARRGYDVRYGARPLKRAIERELLAPLAEKMNAYSAETPLTVAVAMKDDAVSLHVRARTDDGGRAVGAGGTETIEKQIVERVVDLRRHMQAMERSSEMREVVNEIFRLSRIEKRQRAGKRSAFHEDVAGMARLPLYRRLRDEMEDQMTAACAREDEALLALHGEGPLDVSRLELDVKAADGTFMDLLVELYLLRFDRPNEMTLSVYSEEPEALRLLSGAYAEIVQQMGGTFELWQFLAPPEGRSQESKLPRRRVVEPMRVLTGEERLVVEPWNRTKCCFEQETTVKSREGVVGLALWIKAKHALGLFGGEGGLHQLVSVKSGGKCLVETDSRPMTGLVEGSFHEPPEGIERRGAIGTQSKRRILHLDRDIVEDVALDLKLTRRLDPLSPVLRELMEKHLRRRAWEIPG